MDTLPPCWGAPSVITPLPLVLRCCYSGMTNRFLDPNVAVPPPAALYFMVNTLLPAVSPVCRKMPPSVMLKLADVTTNIAVPLTPAAIVEAPETAQEIWGPSPAVLLFMNAEMPTRAAMPVVTVTIGPTVARSVAVSAVVVCAVEMNPLVGVRAARAFAAVDTRICPPWVTSAGAVWFRLSRVLVLCCDAV